MDDLSLKKNHYRAIWISDVHLGTSGCKAELLLDFPIDDHEPLSVQEREDINEALNTTELTENEIYDIISGLESMIEQEFLASGKLEKENRVVLNMERKKIWRRIK